MSVQRLLRNEPIQIRLGVVVDQTWRRRELEGLAREVFSGERASQTVDHFLHERRPVSGSLPSTYARNSAGDLPMTGMGTNAERMRGMPFMRTTD